MSPTTISPENLPAKKPRVLAFCDTPTVRPDGIPGAQQTTGFATVGRALFTAWNAAGVDVDVWALHFDGWGYDQVPWKLFPAGRDWHTPTMLSAFLAKMCSGDYTHVWLLMNAETLSQGNFPKQFKACCEKYGIHATLYFPLDAENPPAHWFEILSAVDVAVTFTYWARNQVLNSLRRATVPGTLPKPLPTIHVLPHGVDDHFQAFNDTNRRTEARSQYLVPKKADNLEWRPFLRSGDFCIVAVNKNEWRKDLLRTLEITKRLIDRGVPAKLILRTAPHGGPGQGGIPIDHAAEKLGLRANVDWTRLDGVTPDELVSLYNSADLCLLTTMGEGWGLTMTEALKCGTPVAVGSHTACCEIGRQVNEAAQKVENPDVLLLGLETGFVMGYENQLRRRVDVELATQRVYDFYLDWKDRGTERVQLAPGILEWLAWPRIGREFLKLMKLGGAA